MSVDERWEEGLVGSRRVSPAVRKVRFITFHYQLAALSKFLNR